MHMDSTRQSSFDNNYWFSEGHVDNGYNLAPFDYGANSHLKMDLKNDANTAVLVLLFTFEVVQFLFEISDLLFCFFLLFSSNLL